MGLRVASGWAARACLAGRAFLSSHGGISALWHLRVGDFAGAWERRVGPGSSVDRVRSAPQAIQKCRQPLGMRPHGDIHKERRFFDGMPVRYPYAKKPQGAIRREGRFRARMIYAVIIQGLTCGCMIARVPEKDLPLGTSP